MAAAVRMHVTERGGNPEAATMVAFGGAGPVHAYNLARKLHIEKLIVPLRAGVLSALGLLVAPPSYDIIRTYKAPISYLNTADIKAQMDGMSAEIGVILDGIQTSGARKFSCALDVGYIGQSYQVTVPFTEQTNSDEIHNTFSQLYRDKYGYFYEDVPAEIVNLRVLGEIVGAGLELTTVTPNESEEISPIGERPAYSSSKGGLMPFSIYDRQLLRPGMKFSGPCVVEEVTSTTIIDEDGDIEVDEYGSLIVSLTGI